jgi:hypothetical protein
MKTVQAGIILQQFIQQVFVFLGDTGHLCLLLLAV